MKKSFIALGFIACLGLAQCTEKKSEQQADSPETSFALVKTPDFNADSAYDFVAAQVNFGPRVPNTQAHEACGNYLIHKLKTYGADVHVQSFSESAFDGKSLNLRNIIASYNPTASKRILLASHWDTRPFADQDSLNNTKPADGANDGASGVGVLLELARLLQTSKLKPDVGVDIIFFDGEDYGEPDSYQPQANEEPGKWWCLGSKYWANNKHKPDYHAYFGILLDMVGGKNAQFAKEGVSTQYAPSVVKMIWQTGQALGYANHFPNINSESITDDHLFINQIAKINMVDIIEYDTSDGAYFSNTWHTHQDNLANIDKNTLKAVGNTLLQVIYAQKQEKQP